MKLLNLSLLAVAIALFPSPRLNAQLLKPIDPNKQADINGKSVSPGEVKFNTLSLPLRDTPNAELSKGNLKLQDADTKNVTDLKSLEFSTVETHVVPKANFTAKRIAAKSSDANNKKLDDAKKKAPITGRQIRPFTPGGEEELKKQLNEPH